MTVAPSSARGRQHLHSRCTISLCSAGCGEEEVHVPGRQPIRGLRRGKVMPLEEFVHEGFDAACARLPAARPPPSRPVSSLAGQGPLAVSPARCVSA